MLDWKDPIVPLIAHDRLDITERAKTPRVFTGLTVQDGECSIVRRLRGKAY